MSMKRKSADYEVTIIESDVTETYLKNSYALRKSLYGITKEQFLQLVYDQDSKCAGCGVDATGLEHLLHVDHNHYTNEIRGLLCQGCNTALGWISDDPVTAERLAVYLKTCGTGVYIPDPK
jgi:hypothetical protein